MSRIFCAIDYSVTEGDYAPCEDGEEVLIEVPMVTATCPRCGHSTKSFGGGGGSVRKCLVLLREECPKNQNNNYMAKP